tara:strand:- start:1204 stop:2163 length:960 start_codon:yes stop_codon:yes gene_type:complete
MSNISKSKQAVLLSATMPKAVRSLANEFLNNPEEVNVAPTARPIELIDQRVFIVKREAKLKFLKDIFDNHNIYRSIVFVRTKIGANKLATKLKTSGIDVDAIHGDKSQSQRTRTLKNFRIGKLNILIATDIAARGIDVDDISHIINYDMPNESEIYIHRIGRTARAGKSGIAISLCDVSEKRKLKSIEKLIGYSLYAKVLNSSETLILGNTNKNSSLKDKINTKNELNSNKVVKSTKKRNSAKLFSKKAKKRFAEKRKKRIQQDNHQSIEKLSTKTNKRKDKKSKNNSVKNSNLTFKKKSNKRKFSLNLDDAFHGKAHN